MPLVTPHVWVPGTDYGTATNLNTVTDAILQHQGRTPGTGSVLDFAIMRQTVVQAVANVSWTSVLLDAEDVDSAGSHSTVTNTNRFTVATPGYYQVNASASFAANATGIRGIRLLISNTTIVQGNVVLLTGTSTFNISLSKLVILGAGAWVDMQVFQSSGGALNTQYTANDSGCSMDAHWVHA